MITIYMHVCRYNIYWSNVKISRNKSLNGNGERAMARWMVIARRKAKKMRLRETRFKSSSKYMNIYRDERKIHFLPPAASVHWTLKNRKEEDLKSVDVGGCSFIRWRTGWHEQIVRNDSLIWMKVYPSARYPGLNPFCTLLLRRSSSHAIFVYVRFIY